jgi:PspAB-like protein
MGFLDVLRGKRKLAQPAPDRLFAMSTAYVTMETSLGLESAGRAAIVFQPLATADFDGIVRDMEEVVRGTGSDAGTVVKRSDDEFGYRWMVLEDRAAGRGLRGAAAVRGVRAARQRRQGRVLDLQLQARGVLPLRPGAGEPAA